MVTKFSNIKSFCQLYIITYMKLHICTNNCHNGYDSDRQDGMNIEKKTLSL